jgi:hypothetical protein
MMGHMLLFYVPAVVVPMAQSGSGWFLNQEPRAVFQYLSLLVARYSMQVLKACWLDFRWPIIWFGYFHLIKIVKSMIIAICHVSWLHYAGVTLKQYDLFPGCICLLCVERLDCDKQEYPQQLY